MAGVTKAEIANFAKMTEMIEQLTEKRNLIRDKIIETVEAGKASTVEFKGVSYSVKHTISNRLDTKAVEENHPATSNPEFYTQKLDTKKVTQDIRDAFSTQTHAVKVEKLDKM